MPKYIKKDPVQWDLDTLSTIVDVVTVDSMAGDTRLEASLNAYLTAWFVLKRGLPNDECLYEAKKVIAMVRAHDARKRKQ